MKSTPALHTHTAITKTDINTTFGATGSRFTYEVTIPKGTLCKKLDGGSDPWVVSNLIAVKPELNGLAYHDASHYGIRVPEAQLTDILPAGAIRHAAGGVQEPANEVNELDDEEGDDDDSKAIIDTTYYVNVYTADTPMAGPDCVTDEHLHSLEAAQKFAAEYMNENQDVISAEISEFDHFADGSGVGSDNPVGYVTRDDVPYQPDPEDQAPGM